MEEYTAFWKSKKFAYDVDDNPIYIGYHSELKPSEDNDDWFIYQYTWSGGNVTDIKRAEGSWTDRVAIFA